MFRLLIFVFLLPIFVFGQKEQSQIYTQAIAQYLKAAKETDKLSMDTLFVGPVDDEVEQSIKNITLPNEILKTKICKLTQAEGERKSVYHKTFVFVNLIGTISKNHAGFIFVTFMVEKSGTKTNWFPKHNFSVDYNYNPQTKSYKFEKQKFEYLYSNKYTEKK